MEVHLDNIQAKFDYHVLDLISRSWRQCFFYGYDFRSISRELIGLASPNLVCSLTKFSMYVNLDNLQAKFDYHELDLIFKVKPAFFIMEIISVEYPEK